jgi:hypothetical protein
VADGATTRLAGDESERGGEADSGVIPLERVEVAEAPDIDPSKPRERTADENPAVKLDVWVLAVPWGTVSNNEAFWKRMDETVVDIGTYDLLYRNGVRVGAASLEEWPIFKEMLDKHPAVVEQTQVTARAEKTFELEVKKDIESQTIFVFDADNSPVGRTYDLADNLLMVGFRRSVAKAGAVRVVVCPVVRSQRKRLEAGKGQGAEIVYKLPEHLYEMNLVAEVPFDRFLVIAPSRDVRHPTNLGRNFLVEETPTERLEKVILIVPSRGEAAAKRVDQKAGGKR